MSTRTLEGARAEVRSIIRELESIERGVRRDFRGIGQDRCANCINAVIWYYQNTVLHQLERMNQNLISRIRNN